MGAEVTESTEIEVKVVPESETSNQTDQPEASVSKDTALCELFDEFANGKMQYCPVDRVFEICRQVILKYAKEDKFTLQPVSVTIKAGTISSKFDLPRSVVETTSHDYRLERTVSELTPEYQQVFGGKPDEWEMFVQGTGKEVGNRFTLHCRVLNRISGCSDKDFIFVKKGGKIAGDYKAPGDGTYLPYIIWTTDQKLSISDVRNEHHDRCRLNWIGAHVVRSYDINDVDNSIEVVVYGPSNIHQIVESWADLSIDEPNCLRVGDVERDQKALVRMFSVPYTLTDKDLRPFENHQDYSLPDGLDANVIYRFLEEGQEPFVSFGVPAYMNGRSGKPISAQTIRKLIGISLVLEDKMYADPFHDCTFLHSKIAGLTYRQLSNGCYVVDVPLFDNGRILTDTLPEVDEWIDEYKTVGVNFRQLRADSHKVLRYRSVVLYRTDFNPVTDYDAPSLNVYATHAAGVTIVGKCPAGRFDMAVFLSFVKFLSEDDRYDYQQQRPNLPSGYDETVPEFDWGIYTQGEQLTNGLTIEAKQVGNYVVVRRGKASELNISLCQIQHAGPIDDDTFCQIWAPNGDVESQSLSVTGLECSIEAITTYQRIHSTANGMSYYREYGIEGALV